MAKNKKTEQPIPKAYANAKKDPRNFEMHPTDVKLFWGILEGAGVLGSLFMIGLVIAGRIENVMTVLGWIILILGIPAVGYVANKESCFKIKNKQITRCSFMMKDRTINLKDIMYYEEKSGRNPATTFLYLYYMNRGRKVYFKIPSSYTNMELMRSVIDTYKWKKRTKL